jgi:hypothetical protein
LDAIGSVSLVTNGKNRLHVHVHAGGDQAKFWLSPVELATNHGFNIRELNEIIRIEGHQIEWLEKWNEYFQNRN